jgi:Na+-driven multidrug efflux pump
MWSFVGMCISLIYGTLLTANGNLRFLNQISIIGILLNIIFNAILIPDYGAAGSAFATLVTQTITSLAQMIYCHVHFSFPITVKQLLNYTAFVCSFVIISCFGFPTIQLLIAQLTIGTIGLFLFKFIDLKTLKKTFAENS